MNRLFKRIYTFIKTFKHQLFVSLFGFTSTCHQEPSCSLYTTTQIKKNGTIVGLIQGLWRSINCRHF